MELLPAAWLELDVERSCRAGRTPSRRRCRSRWASTWLKFKPARKRQRQREGHKDRFGEELLHKVGHARLARGDVTWQRIGAKMRPH